MRASALLPFESPFPFLEFAEALGGAPLGAPPFMPFPRTSTPSPSSWKLSERNSSPEPSHGTSNLHPSTLVSTVAQPVLKSTLNLCGGTSSSNSKASNSSSSSNSSPMAQATPPPCSTVRWSSTTKVPCSVVPLKKGGCLDLIEAPRRGPKRGLRAQAENANEHPQTAGLASDSALVSRLNALSGLRLAHPPGPLGVNTAQGVIAEAGLDNVELVPIASDPAIALDALTTAFPLDIPGRSRRRRPNLRGWDARDASGYRGRIPDSTGDLWEQRRALWQRRRQHSSPALIASLRRRRYDEMARASQRVEDHLGRAANNTQVLLVFTV